MTQDSPRMFVVFLGNTLEENKVISMMKVPQWCVFNRLMDAATQIWFVMKQSTNLKLKTWFLALKECESSHTIITTTTGSKNSQKDANNQTDNQNSVLCPQRSLLYRFLVLDEVKRKTHSATISVDDNQLKCCSYQQAQLKQLRLVNLTTFHLIVIN